MGCCSTCGQELPESRLLIDLNTNTVTQGGVVTKLAPLDAELLSVLQEAAPRFVTPRFIEDRLLGLESEERCEAWTRIRVKMLREKLRALPLKIENRTGVGYRLVVVAA